MSTQRTVHCPACDQALNLPEWAAGKKLKCPKCSAKFKMAPDDGRSPSSTFLLQSFEPTKPPTTVAATATRPPAVSSGCDLRDAFGLPLLNELAAGPSARPAPAPVPIPVPIPTPAPATEGDALALFADGPAPGRRPDAAAARSKPRRCPTCGGLVPAGMSLCSACGLDLESGTRVDLTDDLMPEAPTRPAIPPLDVAIVGGICLLASTILALVATARGPGWGYFVPVCGFGIFASIQFLRGRSARLLLTALSLGALIDLAALVAMPIIEANMEPAVVQRTVIDQPDAADVAIRSVVDQLDTRRLGWGIGLLLAYPVAAAYLISPAARRHFSRRATASSV